jgi:N-acetylglucosaminyldiphosphoundecaprenol N-acetyl-beta-D-mannosaminyltransferase
MSSASDKPPFERLKLGWVWIDRLNFAQALDAIEGLVQAKRGGRVYTPNVDHVVLAEDSEAFREAYAHVELSLVDGKPLLWAASLLGVPLPEKISGSDLVWPLLERAGQRSWRVYLLGGPPGVGEQAARVMADRYGVNVVGVDAPRVLSTGELEAGSDALEKLKAARPDLVVVGLGAPKQELFIHRHFDALRPAVALGLGASIDFVAGRVKRAPKWMSNAGLEWLYRLSREPKRLWRRYLVNDPKFLAVLARALREPKAERVRRGAL